MWQRQPGGGSLGSGGRSADAENYVTLWRLGGVGRLRRAVARSDETFWLSMLDGIKRTYIDAHFSHGRRSPDVSLTRDKRYLLPTLIIPLLGLMVVNLVN